MQPRSRSGRLVSRTVLSVVCVGVIGLAGCAEDGTGSVTAIEPTATESTAAATTVAADPATPTTIGTASPANIVYTAVNNGNFLTLASLLANADLVTTLKGPGPFTVFAPTDDAFAKVPKETLAAVAADPELLKKVLLYHVVPGNFSAAELKDGDVVTAAGPSVKVANVGGAMTINDARVTARDVKATNGVIHVIDTVLLPPT